MMSALDIKRDGEWVLLGQGNFDSFEHALSEAAHVKRVYKVCTNDIRIRKVNIFNSNNAMLCGSCGNMCIANVNGIVCSTCGRQRNIKS